MVWGGGGKEGVCPGEFARQLMATAERESSFLAICSTALAYLMRGAHNDVKEMKVRIVRLPACSS